MKTKIFVLLFPVFLLMTSCGRIAIHQCQKAKIVLGNNEALTQLAMFFAGLPDEAMWKDFTNKYTTEQPNVHMDWDAHKSTDAYTYLVEFTDSVGWGFRWEVNIKEKTVLFVNTNEYLCRKYGLSRLDQENTFKVLDFERSVLKVERDGGGYYRKPAKKVFYIMSASVLNNSGKTLTHAELTGTLQVIFKEKTVEGRSSWRNGFKSKVSMSNPWKPGTKRKFFIRTEGLDLVYLDYTPEFVFFNINLSASDPVGYTYDKDILEFHLLNKWKRLSQERH